MEGRKKSRKQRSYANQLSDAELVYCEQVAKDGDCWAALLAAYPDVNEISKRAADKRIERLNKKQLVKEKIAEIRARFSEKTADKYDGLKEWLIDKMVDGIKAATEENPAAMTMCTGLVKQISLMMGYDQPQKQTVTVKNGGLSDDYKPPQNILEMSDDDLEALLK